MSTSSRYPDLHRPPYTIDLNEGHQQEQLFHDHHHQLLFRHHSSTPVSFSRLQSVSRDQIGFLCLGSQLHPSPYHQETDFGSCDRKALEIDKGANHAGLKFTLLRKEDRVVVGDNGGGCADISGNWTPLRVMKGVRRGDDLQKDQLPPLQVQAETRHLIRNALIGGSSSNIRSSCNNNNDNTSIRVCSDCNTTKTPLWRSGPRGPKSLCNACGIRQRKARRAMALAANGSLIPNGMSAGSTMRAGSGHKKAPNNNNGTRAPKKRSKIVKPSEEHQQNGAQRKLCLEEFALKLSKKLSLQQVFPQEEKEAAILLMALSCGLVHG